MRFGNLHNIFEPLGAVKKIPFWTISQFQFSLQLLPTCWGENHWTMADSLEQKYDTATWTCGLLKQPLIIGKVRKWSSEQVRWYENWLQLSGCEKPCKQGNPCKSIPGPFSEGTRSLFRYSLSPNFWPGRNLSVDCVFCLLILSLARIEALH